jgi:hypothetical protein
VSRDQNYQFVSFKQREGSKMLITILLLAILLAGLVLLAVGIVLLFKVKNKLAGWVSVAVGVAFTMFANAIILMLTITTSIQGGM